MAAKPIEQKQAEKAKPQDLFRELGSSDQGLTDDEAGKRLEQMGPNTLEEKKKSAFRKFLGYFWGPIPWMIEVAAILSAVLQHWLDLIIIFALLLINAVIGFWEEHKADTALAALKSQLAMKARVRRNSKWREIEAAQLVPGDVVRLRLGDVVPADAKLFDGEYLSVDQSALTGESLPVSKKKGDMAYSGSIAKQGEMAALVTATGKDTFFGRTAGLVEAAGAPSHFEQAVLRVGRFLILIAIGLSILLVVVELFRHLPFLGLIQFVLIVVIASIPVAMPAVLSVTMALGAMALSREKAIVSHLQAIEEMAGINILCSDKTGTLTQNKLTAEKPTLYAAKDPKEVFLVGSLASKEEDQDVIDKAVLAGLHDDKLLKSYKQTNFVPFDPIKKRTEATITDPSGKSFRVAKGAPQVIIKLCNLDQQTLARANKDVEDFASKGYRTLGVARTENGDKWSFLGILPLQDPPREDSADTIRRAQEHGVDVKMVTGDNTAIARQIARELNLGTNIHPAEEFFGETTAKAPQTVGSAGRKRPKPRPPGKKPAAAPQKAAAEQKQPAPGAERPQPAPQPPPQPAPPTPAQPAHPQPSPAAPPQPAGPREGEKNINIRLGENVDLDIHVGKDVDVTIHSRPAQQPEPPPAGAAPRAAPTFVIRIAPAAPPPPAPAGRPTADGVKRPVGPPSATPVIRIAPAAHPPPAPAEPPSADAVKHPGRPATPVVRIAPAAPLTPAPAEPPPVTPPAPPPVKAPPPSPAAPQRPGTPPHGVETPPAPVTPPRAPTHEAARLTPDKTADRGPADDLDDSKADAIKPAAEPPLDFPPTEDPGNDSRGPEAAVQPSSDRPPTDDPPDDPPTHSRPDDDPPDDSTTHDPPGDCPDDPPDDDPPDDNPDDPPQPKSHAKKDKNDKDEDESEVKISPEVAVEVERADGFAQVFPEHKYAIVKALQAQDFLVGMTGDGVNDAPALKQADVGIAVSGATEAARSAADLVLTKPGLSVIINAIEEARRIFERMLSYTIYRIAMTIDIMLFVVTAMIAFNTYPLTAIMIIILALLDDIPIMTIAEDNALLDPKPVRWDMHRVLWISVVLGVLALFESFGMLLIGIYVLHLPKHPLQTMMFLQLVAGGHLMLFLTRTRRSFWQKPHPSWPLFTAIVGTQILAIILCWLGWLVPPIGWVVIGIVWGYNIVWMFFQDIVKLLTYRWVKPAQQPEAEHAQEGEKASAGQEEK